MAVTVDVTQDGNLSINVDGTVYPPLSIEAVQAANARVTDAQNVIASTQLATVMRSFTDVLTTRPAAATTATLTLSNGEVTAQVDQDSFTALATQLDLTPNSAGALVMGPLTITHP